MTRISITSRNEPGSRRSRSIRRWFPILTAVGILAAGCLDVDTPDRTIQSSAVLEGRVTGPDGAALSSPFVAVQLLTPPVNGVSRVLIQSNVYASEQGHFLFLFLLDEPPQDATALIVVNPPLGSNLAPLDTAGVPIRINAGENPIDTTYVELKLDPR